MEGFAGNFWQDIYLFSFSFFALYRIIAAQSPFWGNCFFRLVRFFAKKEVISILLSLISTNHSVF